jgi:hypothetical protein
MYQQWFDSVRIRSLKLEPWRCHLLGIYQGGGCCVFVVQNWVCLIFSMKPSRKLIPPLPDLPCTPQTCPKYYLYQTQVVGSSFVLVSNGSTKEKRSFWFVRSHIYPQAKDLILRSLRTVYATPSPFWPALLLLQWIGGENLLWHVTEPKLAGSTHPNCHIMSAKGARWLQFRGKHWRYKHLQGIKMFGFSGNAKGGSISNQIDKCPLLTKDHELDRQKAGRACLRCVKCPRRWWSWMVERWWEGHHWGESVEVEVIDVLQILSGILSSPLSLSCEKLARTKDRINLYPTNTTKNSTRRGKSKDREWALGCQSKIWPINSWLDSLCN